MHTLQLIKSSLKAFRRSPPAVTPALTSVALLTHIAALSRTAEHRTCEGIFAVATGAVAPPPSPAVTGDSAWSANSAGLVRRSRKADIRMMGQMRAYAEQTRSLASWHERSDSETPEPEEEEAEDDDSEAEFLDFSAQEELTSKRALPVVRPFFQTALSSEFLPFTPRISLIHLSLLYIVRPQQAFVTSIASP